MSFFGMVFNYMLRVNINLAIVAMVKAKNDSNSTMENDVCGYGEEMEDGSSDSGGEFEWDEFTQSMITGAFFWGYIWTQIPGGRMASIVSCLVPVAARAGAPYLIAVSPAGNVRGSQAGTIIAYPMASAIIESIGWESVFYIQAGLTLGWCALWFLIVSDNPEKSKLISQAEKDYIIESFGESKDRKPPPVPLKSILTSMPFWAIFIAGVGNNWGFYTLLTDLPLFMHNMLMQDIKSNAILSGMPYLGMWIFSLLVSFVSDRLRMSGKLSTGAVRKIANTIAHIGPAICLLCLTTFQCNRPATIALLFIAVGLQGGIYTGFMVNHVDIETNFAGTLFGITNTAATIPGWVAPMTVGALTNNNQTFGQWNKVFFISAVWFIGDAIFFLIFASGEEQPWNKIAEEAHIKKDRLDSAKLSISKPPKDKSSSLSQKRFKSYDDYVTDTKFRNTFHNSAYQHES